MSSAKFDCLCAGIVVADHVCEPIDHVPAPGELVLSPRMSLEIGGCAANVGVDLCKLGRRAAIVGRIGSDIFGTHVRGELEKSGLDCRWLAKSDTPTAGSFVINVRGEDRRFIHSTGANAEFTGREVTADILAQARVLYLGGYCLSDALAPEIVAAMFQAARAAGVQTVLDVVIPKPGNYARFLDPVLPLTDVFCPNNDEAELLSGLVDPEAQAADFVKRGARSVVITCGGAGAVLVSRDARLRSGAFEIEFVDGTGSGDAFVAGYIDGLLRGATPSDCLKSGAALGASCVRASGATVGVFTGPELEQFLATHDLPFTRI